MRRDRIVAGVALALALAGCGKKDEGAAASGTPAASTAAAVPAPAGQDWTETVVATPEGGFRMGNPDAAVKFVEYASFTCPHCAHFTEEAADKLHDYVRKGTLSWEFRPFLLNAMDLAPSLLVTCQGAGPAFRLAEQLYADQQNWAMKYQQLSQDEITRIQGLSETDQRVALAKAGGLDTFFGARGLPAAKAEACLTDKAAADKLVALRDLGTGRDGVTGTPSFVVNGTPAKTASDWATLEPVLTAAGA
jgi:protein-disulfide isomerase